MNDYQRKLDEKEAERAAHAAKVDALRTASIQMQPGWTVTRVILIDADENGNLHIPGRVEHDAEILISDEARRVLVNLLLPEIIAALKGAGNE